MCSHICNLKLYMNWGPTRNDTRGLRLPDRQTWYVAPVIRTRDSSCLEESNFAAAQKLLGESDDVELHRFGHWANGWFEILLIRPDSDALQRAHEIEERFAGYPILDENDLSEREHERAHEVWRNCYSESERIDYIRRHRHDFEFHSFADLMGCVRGKYFAGDAASLIGE